MALIEAVLTYKPCGTGSDTPVPIGKTDDPRVLRALRDRLLQEATEEAQMWRGIDPGVAVMQTGELRRLATVLSFLLPDEDLRPDLRPIDGKQEVEEEKGPAPPLKGSGPTQKGRLHEIIPE